MIVKELLSKMNSRNPIMICNGDDFTRFKHSEYDRAIKDYGNQEISYWFNVPNWKYTKSGHFRLANKYPIITYIATQQGAESFTEIYLPGEFNSPEYTPSAWHEFICMTGYHVSISDSKATDLGNIHAVGKAVKTPQYRGESTIHYWARLLDVVRALLFELG